MKIYFQSYICLLLIVAFGGVIRADVAVPPVGEQIRVELGQNYPEWQFFIASYRRETRPDPYLPHKSRPDMAANAPGSFQIKAIELTKDDPFIQPIGSSRISVNRQHLAEYAYWLVAVKKSDTAETKNKIKNAIDSGENSPDIVFVGLADTFQTDSERALGARVIVNQVTGLNEKGLEINVSEGSSELPTVVKPANFIAFGLLLTGLAFFGLWWNKRRYV